MSLGVHKFVYVHEDDENTLILRSFYPDAAEGLRRYGVRGTECIKEMFLGIPNLIGMTSKGGIFLFMSEVFKLLKYINYKKHVSIIILYYIRIILYNNNNIKILLV